MKTLLLSLLLVLVLAQADLKNRKSLIFLQRFPGGLQLNEACVMCRYVVQKVDKAFDSTRECPEISESQYIKDKQREFQPEDLDFLEKWKQMYQLKQKQSEERMKPFEHEDDHYYYIIHPDHIKNYIGEFMQQPGGGSNHQQKKAIRKNNLKDMKSISYHDVDNQLPFPNEFKVSHEYQKLPKMMFKEQEGQEDSQNKEQEPVYSSGSYLQGQIDPDNHRQDATYVDRPNIVTKNGIENNSNINDEFRFKAESLSLHQKKQEDNAGEDDNRATQDQNLNQEEQQQMQQQDQVMQQKQAQEELQKQEEYAAQQSVQAEAVPQEGRFKQSQRQESQENKFEDVQLKIKSSASVIDTRGLRTPLNLNQHRFDRIFKDYPNQRRRFNQDPDPRNYLQIEDTQSQGLNGSFIIDKNINRGELEPTSLLLPQRNVMKKSAGGSDTLLDDSFRFKQSPPESSLSPPLYSKEDRDTIYQNFLQLKEENESSSSPDPSFMELTARYSAGRPNLFLPSVDSEKDSYSPKFPQMSQNHINYPMVNTDKNFFDIVNTGQKYIAYGKALLPPHPEDLYPGFPCCMMFPCVEKPPCNDDDLKFLLDQDKKTASRFRFQEKEEEEEEEEEEGLQPQFIAPPAMYSLPFSSFLQVQLQSQKGRKKKKTGEDGLVVEDSVYLFNPESGRRGRRRKDLPDPQWDCADKNINDLLHFICEQEVAKSFIKFCKPILESKNQVIEGFLYHDSSLQICQEIHMCPYQ